MVQSRQQDMYGDLQSRQQDMNGNLQSRQQNIVTFSLDSEIVW